MLAHIETVATLIGSVIVISTFAFTIWRWSIRVNDMIKQVQDTACKVDILERRILRSLTQLQAQTKAAEEKCDQRLDRIEGKLSYLFGITNTPLPPKD